MQRFSVIPIPAYKDNYIWLIKKSDANKVIVVDPGEAKPVLDYLHKNHLQICAILLTHKHGDHVNGVTELLENFDVPVFGANKDLITTVTHEVGENDLVNIAELDMQFKVIEIPGHTLEHIAYFGHGLLFSGDTLFTCGCGRVFEGTYEQMYHSLQKLAMLPKETLVYCGHEYTENNIRFAMQVEPENLVLQNRLVEVRKLRENNLPSVPTTLDLELQTNPFLRCDQSSVKLAAEKYSGEKIDNAEKVFEVIRKWKDVF